MRQGKRIAYAGFARFNAWFTSRGGVYQTLMAVGALVVLEATRVLHDPNGFWLLYWLTIYSAITQPALAAASRTSAEATDAMLRRLEQKEEIDAALLTSIDAHLRALVAQGNGHAEG